MVAVTAGAVGGNGGQSYRRQTVAVGARSKVLNIRYRGIVDISIDEIA